MPAMAHWTPFSPNETSYHRSRYDRENGHAPHRYPTLRRIPFGAFLLTCLITGLLCSTFTLLISLDKGNGQGAHAIEQSQNHHFVVHPTSLLPGISTMPISVSSSGGDGEQNEIETRNEKQKLRVLYTEIGRVAPTVSPSVPQAGIKRPKRKPLAHGAEVLVGRKRGTYDDEPKEEDILLCITHDLVTDCLWPDGKITAASGAEPKEKRDMEDATMATPRQTSSSRRTKRRVPSGASKTSMSFIEDSVHGGEGEQREPTLRIEHERNLDIDSTTPTSASQSLPPYDSTPAVESQRPDSPSTDQPVTEHDSNGSHNQISAWEPEKQQSQQPIFPPISTSRRMSSYSKPTPPPILIPYVIQVPHIPIPDHFSEDEGRPRDNGGFSAFQELPG